MNPNIFFKNERILRSKDFSLTFAVNQELENTIAYANDLRTLNSINKIPNISIVITKDDLSELVIESKGVIVSENPKKDFFQLHNFMIDENYIKPLNGNSIDETASIAPTCKIGHNVVIGKNVIINDFVVIESNTVIGDDCEIDSFVIIGAKSMQRTIIDGQLFHLKFAGGVKIGNRAKVLTGAIIQKPYQAFYTTIGDDSVVSTNVIIGHGSKVGNRTLLSGGSGIAGNCNLGDDVWIGAGAVISDGIRIENKAQVHLGSVVIKDLKSNEIVSGNFAINHKSNIKHHIKLKQ